MANTITSIVRGEPLRETLRRNEEILRNLKKASDEWREVYERVYIIEGFIAHIRGQYADEEIGLNFEELISHLKLTGEYDQQGTFAISTCTRIRDAFNAVFLHKTAGKEFFALEELKSYAHEHWENQKRDVEAGNRLLEQIMSLIEKHDNLVIVNEKNQQMLEERSEGKEEIQESIRLNEENAERHLQDIRNCLHQLTEISRNNLFPFPERT